ncbi:50S ribosomal protein L25 [Brevibacillus sp. HB1.2]|uniref:Large ribosomal subunit protein bL25 n=1 Tax=Brevibacillus porteri TaxID=2126350 RepID=A0ABX5FGK9_9BACL|nr:MULTISPECIES: 50S ribosomal protein L25 [Brevibacillus]ATF10634.1 50S ribosomal protein L25 [Brevibacillus brevis X23]NTU23760.1 50S ribosomal protein L25 [Brevibacillus sp. HB1.2]NTU33962.1 50S ribosomal protein L25 [Brevibacillus sp. HB1.1]MDC0764641.1 50S ribosomal protein L25 [Brevibacillus sp. AG]MED1801918.1 50S ribosomal protein L25 [Brevibacillus porteri]
MEQLQAQSREKKTGNAVKVLRKEGWVPGIMYGSEVGNKPIQLKGRELDAALRHQTTNKPFRLSVDGDTHDVMVYELQRHPLQGNILHADFKKINMNEKIHTSVPVLMTGDPELGVATLVRHSVEVTCLPGNIPESFLVDVDGFNIGDVVLVADLTVPPGVELGLDSTEVLISVLPVKVKSEESIDAEQEAEAVAEKAGTANE